MRDPSIPDPGLAGECSSGLAMVAYEEDRREAAGRLARSAALYFRRAGAADRAASADRLAATVPLPDPGAARLLLAACAPGRAATVL